MSDAPAEPLTALPPNADDADARAAASLIGVQSALDFWLLDLSDSGEIVPLTPLTPVPLTRAWFAGIANIRGNLYAVTDFSAFQGKNPTPQNSSSRFLLVGTRFGSNAALLVTRMLGLRKAGDLTRKDAASDDPPWVEGVYSDKDARVWKKLNVRALLSDKRFMEIGV
ncbi:MAG: chemotaxis protein CheW [Candidatus Accumulibacter sp.]|jgi:twitching motility protein PilI|nr:chemotaxis protein CheW [Accumulibacter sp.]